MVRKAANSILLGRDRDKVLDSTGGMRRGSKDMIFGLI